MNNLQFKKSLQTDVHVHVALCDIKIIGFSQELLEKTSGNHAS
jgi:hypothetical protein